MSDFFKAFLSGPIQRWLAAHGRHDLAVPADAISGALPAILLTVFGWLVWLASRARQAWNVRRLANDLHPYFSTEDVARATRYFVPSNFQSVSPSSEEEPGKTSLATARQALIPWMLQEALAYGRDNRRYYIILGGAGMGKTTLMINLYLRYRRQWPWFRRRFAIALLPLGYPDVLAKIKSIEKPGETILLLDAFDEDPLAAQNYRKRLSEIIACTKEFREVVITCRTHFFPSEEEEPKETGLLRFGGEKGEHVFTKLYLSPFDSRDLNSYLRRRFPFWRLGRRRKARRVAELSPSLMARPMLLEHIDDLYSESSQFRYMHEIYAVLIERWIGREAERQSGEKQKKEFAESLRQLSRTLALDLYRRRTERGGLEISLNELERFAQEHQIALNEIDVRSRSLLNRTARGSYKFAHKSILEYLLAVEVAKDDDFLREFSFDGMDVAKQFCRELAIARIPAELCAEIGFPRQPVKDRDMVHVFMRERRNVFPLALLLTAPADGSMQAKRQEWIRLMPKGFDLAQVTSLSVPEGCPKLVYRLLGDLLALPSLTSLDLGFTPKVALDGLAQLPQLTALDMHGGEVTSIAPLRVLSGLKRLNISFSAVADLGPLTEQSQIEFLDADHTPITDLAPVSALTGLKHLSLRQTRVRDLEPLRGCSQLETLDLEATPIETLEPLDSPALQRLNVAETRIEVFDFSGPLPALRELVANGAPVQNIERLAQQPELTSLSLANTPLTNLLPLRGMKLHWLNLAGTKPDDFTPIWTLRKLASLMLSRTTFAQADLDVLQANASALTELDYLSLASTAIESLGALSPLPSLRQLDVGYTRIEHVPTNALHKIEDLRINGTSVASLHFVERLQELMTLDVSDTAVTDLEPLRGKRLLELHLAGTQPASLDAIWTLKSLRRLNLSRVRFVDIAPISQLGALQALELSGTSLKTLEPLAPLAGLDKLDVNGTAVDDLRPLQKMKQLRTLYIAGTQVRDLSVLGDLPELQSVLTGSAVNSDELERAMRRSPRCVFESV